MRKSSKLPLVVTTAPEKIYLQIAGDCYYEDQPFPDEHDDQITWCADSVESCEVPYIRADLATPAQTVDVDAIPDAKHLPDLMMASYHEAVGWNAYREALLTRAIDSHLVTPAQTVDVDAVKSVIEVLRLDAKTFSFTGSDNAHFVRLADKLSQAIGDKT